METKRNELPSRRRGYNQKLKIGRHTFYLRTSVYPDGRLGEIFIDASREGTMLRAVMSGIAMAVSIGLQHGVPLKEFVEAFAYMRFDPSGRVECHKKLTYGTSILDVIFRDLGISYLGLEELASMDAQNSDLRRNASEEPATPNNGDLNVGIRERDDHDGPVDQGAGI